MIKVVAVGKVREKALGALIGEYVKRLSGYTKLELIEVSDEAVPSGNSDAENEQAKDAEAARILARIKDSDYVILVDLHGTTLDSLEFAKKFQELQTYGQSNITFVIGGSLGFGREAIRRANLRWKLSDLTFPHQIVRLLILEQLYRCYKIIGNEPYHK